MKFQSCNCGYPPRTYPVVKAGTFTHTLRSVLAGAMILLTLSGIAQTSSFSFSSIPASDPDLNAPFRGVEQWHDRNDVNVPNAATSTPRLDMYWRFTWNSFESTQGNYTWTTFDNMVNGAIDAGKKFGFGIMTVYPGPDAGAAGILNYNGANSAYPQYLHNLMQAESVKDWVGAMGDWIPNWNSSNYLARLNALYAAIYDHLNTTTYKGFRYKDVINYIDVRGFGSWGEWHSYGIAPTNDVSSYPAGTFPTVATFKAIIDAHVNNLPDIQLVMMLATLDGGYLGNTMVPAEIGVYALQARNARGPLGLRRDQWGATDAYIPMYLENNNRGFGAIPQMSTEIMARWKTAPILGEPPGWVAVSGGVDFGDLPRQVNLYHAVSFGNGNYGGTPSAQAGDMIRQASKACGYRLVLTGGNVNSSITPGTPFTINLNWQNLGITPTYENWNVVYELRNASNVAVWSGNSNFKLRLFLPATAATTASDNFTIPATVTSGNYKLVVVVRDPIGFRKPLPLAITGVNSDGSYTLATVSVGTSGNSANTPPKANAGTAQNVTLPNSTATLTGTGTDADGTISSYAWSQVSGPSAAVIASPNSASTAVSALVAGTYTFRLTVIDNGGATASADVTVTVAAVNKPPLVSAGSAISVTLPANTATLTGTATDSDGSIASYAWTKVSGPMGGAISSPSAASTSVTGLLAGTYTYKLTATDNQGATGSATVTVTVSATPNIAPTVSAGAAQTITLPTSSVTATGTAKDVDGTISAYAWSQVSGPVTAKIVSVGSASTSITGLTTAGIYIFKLTATDNSGAATSADLTITVDPDPGSGPVANAGKDQILTLPTNATTLDGSASSDASGSISTYTWSQLSGPSTATLGNSNAVSTTVSNLVKGSYQFQLFVRDDKNATSTDKVMIIVNDANQPAVIKLPSDTIEVTLPVNNAVLDATASYDPDGVINAFAWTQLSGPSNAGILSPASARTTVNSLAAGTYAFNLAVTDNKGAVSNQTVVVIVSYSNTRVASQAFAVYPNPVQSVANISLSSDMEGKAVYQVTDMNGRALISGEFTKVSGDQSLRIDMNSLRPGVYFLKLQVNDLRVGVKKLMKL